ncbi:MAG: hypothetical protein KA099_06315 [Alphaproteobacteria bacterium]|nr:hypothetical protein [Alphaproteobacteria bacterium]MBP7759889.1 hypothetical protein [Alphaproteobacteria bacterium]MBP7763268.1 hypothetical protein [Alphaproteobacteria bacterium]MBP7904923.1 hypothetical protein [Alphaproteobacteria bacterium]
MAVPNPQYRENWKEIHDAHDAACTASWEKMQEVRQRQHVLYDAGQHDTDEYRSLEDEYKVHYKAHGEHHRTCHDCLSFYQHRTVQDGAKWLFGQFDPDMGSTTSRTFHLVDFDKFKTLDEVYEAWAQASDASQQAEAEARDSLPHGRPNGKNIFEQTGTNQITSLLQDISGEELYPQPYRLNQNCRVLVTTDIRNGEYHICFTQDDEMVNECHMGIQPHFEAVATAMYNRALMAEKESSRRKALTTGETAPSWSSRVSGALTTLVNKVIPKRDIGGISPEQFHFYIHHPAKPGYPESFYEMPSEFKNCAFINPRFVASKVIPELIHDAYKEYKQRPVSGRRMETGALNVPVEVIGYEGQG